MHGVEAVVIRVIFEGVGVDAHDKVVQSSIANLIKKQLERVTCDCLGCHIVVCVGGPWRTGEYEVQEVTSCCLKALAAANQCLLVERKKKPFVAGFARSGLGQSRAQGAGLFSVH